MHPFLEQIRFASFKGPESIEEYLGGLVPVSDAAQRHRFVSALLTLYFQAELKRSCARSYRDFRVACAAWAFKKDASTIERLWVPFYGLNSKAGKDARNICAEPVALDGAEANGYTSIIGVVIVAETQEDDLGLHPTLRPCTHCRDYMRHHPLITAETIIVTVLPPTAETDSLDDVVHEVHTFKELCQAYGEPWKA